MELGDRYVDAVVVGRGAAGTVHRAKAVAFGRDVAVKVFHATLAEERLQRAFRRECEMLGALGDHPNLVPVHDGGLLPDGRPYVVLAWCDLGSVPVGEPLAPGEAAALGAAVADGLQFAHERGILHRHVTPRNVLRRGTGVGLSDFSIGVLATDGPAHDPEYTAPEALAGGGSVAADVFGLAATVHALLAGAAPFPRIAGESDEAYRERRTTRPGPALPDAVPPALARAVLEALEPDPEHRTPSARAFAGALREAATADGLTLALPAVTQAVPAGPVVAEPVVAEPVVAEPVVAADSPETSVLSLAPPVGPPLTEPVTRPIPLRGEALASPAAAPVASPAASPAATPAGGLAVARLLALAPPSGPPSAVEPPVGQPVLPAGRPPQQRPAPTLLPAGLPAADATDTADGADPGSPGDTDVSAAAGDRPEEPSRRRRGLLVVGATAAVAAVAAAAVVVTTMLGGGGTALVTPGSSSAPAPVTVTVTAPSGSTSAPTSAPTASTAGSPTTTPTGPATGATSSAGTSSATPQDPKVTVAVPVVRRTGRTATMSVTVGVDRPTTFTVLRLVVKRADGTSFGAVDNRDGTLVEQAVTLSGSRTVVVPGRYTAVVRWSLGGRWFEGPQTAFTIHEFDTNGVWLGTPQAQVGAGGKVTLSGRVEVTQRVHFVELQIAVRLPGDVAVDAAGNALDLAFHHDTTTLSSGATIGATRVYDKGTYTANMAYLLSDGTWHNGPNITFTVR